MVAGSGESRFVPRPFVADNSALPKRLGGPNATLTTQALAARTAESVFVRYSGGERWVTRASPVASTDAALTAAA